MAAWLSPVLGAVVGLVLALTGAGGGILAVPLLVFGLHLGIAQAGPVALLAVALSAGLGAVLGLASRTLRYRAAGLMALAGMAASPAGLWVAARLPERPLAVLFALVLAFAAWRMFDGGARELRGQDVRRAQEPPCRFDGATGRLRWTPACAGTLAMAGAVAGFLSGLLGVGGGFVVVPVLLAVTDLPMMAVTATSMGVLALIALAGAGAAALAGTLQVDVAWPFALGALAGLLGGRLVASRLAGPRLQQGFALLAGTVAAVLLVRAAL
jgi:uncharacterized protein